MTTAAATRPATRSKRTAFGTAAASAVTGASLLGHQRAAGPRELRELLLADLRVAEAERVQGVDDRRRDADPREPLVVGRDDVPGGALARRAADHVLVGAHVLLPVAALLGVRR